jgi:SAM-dependent methyltransferase
MSLGIQHSTYPLPRQAWPRTLAALKLAVAMLLPDGSASAQARKDYAQTPTPKAVARRMLEIGGAGPNDLVADLGSGDGRIPILAAQVFGARAIGVELDQALHAAALANVQRTGTSERVTLIHGDLFETRLADVTLLTLYLPPSLTLRLRRRILSEMQPGARVVSHEFGMGAWLPDRKQVAEGRTILLWVVPARVDGRWRLEADGEIIDLHLRQTFQDVAGTAMVKGQSMPLLRASLNGKHFQFSIAPPGSADRHFRARVEQGTMAVVEGHAHEPGVVSGWRAVRH